MSINHTYQFCPIGGIVCCACQYPVSPGTVDGIRRHENKSPKHKDSTTIEARHKIVAGYCLYIDGIVKDLATTKDKLMDHLSTQQLYYFCTHCDRLVNNRKSHKGGRHFKYCTDQQLGFMSKLWNRKEPLILNNNFKYDDKHLNDSLKEKIYSSGISESNRSSIIEIMKAQKAVFQEQERQRCFKEVDQTINPDLWVARAGWYYYFKGFNRIDIYQITLPKQNDSIDLFGKQLENGFLCAVNNLKQKYPASHHLYFEIERRKSSTYPLKPYRYKTNATYVKYIRWFTTMLRIIIAVENYHKSVGNVDERKYPLIFMSENQKLLLSAIEQDPDSFVNYVDFLLSLSKVTYNESPYECTLICVLAFICVNNDGTYKSVADCTPIFAAVLGVYKIIIMYKSFITASDDETVVDNVKHLVRLHMMHPEDILSYPTCMSWVINIFAYATAISKSKNKEGFVSWSHHVLHFKAIKLSMVDFRSAIETNVAKCQQLLLKLCEKKKMLELPTIPYATTYDDVNNTSMHYSFLTDSRNTYYELELEKFSSGRSDFDCGSVGDIARLKTTTQDFLQLLLCLIHVTSGQPARGTEICPLQHTNGDTPRNFFFYGDLICMFTSYHKSMIQMDQTKDICRFLPNVVGDMLVYYLWLVLPYYQSVVSYGESKQNRSTFLFTNDIVSDLESSVTWNSIKFSSLLKFFFKSTIGVDIDLSSYRHIPIAIVREYLIKYVTVKESDEEISAEEATDGKDNCIWDLQAGHSSATSLRNYARGVNESYHSNNTTINKYRFISIAWHNFILRRNTNVNYTSNDSLNDALLQQQKQRFATLLKLKPESIFSHFMQKSGVALRGNQKQVLDSIFKNSKHILQIAATGIGKSISFMLPAFATTGGTTIVIVPLLSLQLDLLQRCQSLKMNCNVWSEMIGHEPYDLVFVTPESATTMSFKNYVNFLLAHHLLDRIVIDEVHLFLASNDLFRPKMRQFYTILEMAFVQLVMITATLPIKYEDKLFQLLRIHGNIEKHRMPTTRKNISYTLLFSSDYKTELEKILHKIGPEERTIIYVRDLCIGNEIERRYGLDFYHRNNPIKNDIYKRWFDGRTSFCIVATSALGCGIDIPNIRYVIHVGVPFSISDYIQESGRAGRDGKDSFSYLIHVATMKFTFDDDMKNLLEEKQCRRRVIDMIMDGEENRETCRNCELYCDLCETNSTNASHLHETLMGITEEDLIFNEDVPIEFAVSTNESVHVHEALTGITEHDLIFNIDEDVPIEVAVSTNETIRAEKRRRIEHINEESIYLFIEDKLTVSTHASCLICALLNLKECTNQTHHQKKFQEAQKRQDNFRATFARSRIKLPHNSICFRCFVPDQFCERRTCGTPQCSHPFTILNVIYAIAALEGKYNNRKLDDCFYVMSEEDNFGGFRTINIVKIFYEMVKSFLEDNKSQEII